MRLLFILLCLPTILFSQVEITSRENMSVFKMVEEMPQFLDCGEVRVLSRSECFQDYLCKNLKYPAFAKKHKVQGEVIVSFEIGTTGKVEHAKIIQDIGAGCGIHTLAFVNAMPNWTPGKQRGIIVPVLYKLSVDYRLPNLDCR